MLLAIGAVAAGFINGLAGFGTALFALGFWLQVFPPLQAVALTVVVASATGLQGLWIVRREILRTRRRLLRFLLPALIGIPIGVWALAYIDPDLLKLVVAGFMLLYGAFFLLRRRLPAFDRPTPVIDRSIGFVSGVLGGLAGLSGALPSMWCAMRPWPRAEIRAVLQPFNFAILAVTAFILALRGAYVPELLPALGITVVIALVAAQVGIAVFKRLGDMQFRWLLIGLMFLSGATLMARTLA